MNDVLHTALYLAAVTALTLAIAPCKVVQHDGPDTIVLLPEQPCPGGGACDYEVTVGGTTLGYTVSFCDKPAADSCVPHLCCTETSDCPRGFACKPGFTVMWPQNDDENAVDGGEAPTVASECYSRFGDLMIPNKAFLHCL